MKRDMDLIRQILMAVEEHPHGFAPRMLEIDGYTKEQVAYHNYLLGDAGLANVADATALGDDGPQAMIISLTSAGHDFIEAARNDEGWAWAKGRLAAVGGATIPIWFDILTVYIKQKLGLSEQ